MSGELDLDKVMGMSEEGGKVVVEPACAREYDLEQLLAAITPVNLHAEIDFVISPGKESFQLCETMS